MPAAVILGGLAATGVTAAVGGAIGAAIVGSAVSAVAATTIGSAVIAGGIAAVQGKSSSDILKSAVLGGVTAGVGADIASSIASDVAFNAIANGVSGQTAVIMGNALGGAAAGAISSGTSALLQGQDPIEALIKGGLTAGLAAGVNSSIYEITKDIPLLSQPTGSAAGDAIQRATKAAAATAILGGSGSETFELSILESFSNVAGTYIGSAIKDNSAKLKDDANAVKIAEQKIKENQEEQRRLVGKYEKTLENIDYYYKRVDSAKAKYDEAYSKYEAIRDQQTADEATIAANVYNAEVDDYNKNYEQAKKFVAYYESNLKTLQAQMPELEKIYTAKVNTLNGSVTDFQIQEAKNAALALKAIEDVAVAKEVYRSDTGRDITDEELKRFAGLGNDLVGAVDRAYTSEGEAREIWRKTVGTEPTEFDLMEIVGLDETQAGNIAYDRADTSTEEAEAFFKDLYGADYEPTADQLMEIVGRPEGTAKVDAQNLYTKDKNWVTEDEAAQFWKDMGNTGPAPQEFLDAMLMTTENGAKAMAETHRITSEDRQATTFDGSGYDTAEQARAAAIGAGFNAFTDPVTGQTRIVMPEDESSKRAQLAQQVLDAQGLTPRTATAEQRQQAINLVGSIAQDKLDSTNVVDLMADAGIAGGSYVKQESNLKYYLTAPPAASAPKSFDGTKYSTQTDAAIAAASRGQNTFAWTDGKTYKVPAEIAADGKSGALRDKALAGDLVSLADAYARGEISNKEYKFLEAGVKKQTEAVNKLVTNRDLKSAQEAAGQTVGWANLGAETKDTISMLDRAADRVLSLGEGAGNLVASLGQTLAAATVWQQGEGDYTTGFVEGIPKQYIDLNGNVLTTSGKGFADFVSTRYSDQAKDERKKITDEIKRPGATEASVAAVVLNNLHGYSTFTGAELAEEVIPFLAGGGIGAALKLGKAGLVAITGSASTIADMSEVYGPTYAKVQTESLKQGDDPATAHAKASQAASGNTLITLATEGPLNFMLAKSLLVGTVKNAAYTVGGNTAAQMAGGYIESMAQNLHEDFVLTGKTPVLDDLNKYRGQATFEALVMGGTTSGMYVLAAANPNKVIGKDYDGNDFTVADAITKPDQFDAKTLDSSAMITDPTTGKTGSFLDVFGDATTKYADGYSTAITESVISKNPTQSLEIMQDMGLADWGPNGEITFSPEAGDIATAFISSNTVLPQSNGTYAPTFNASSLSGVTRPVSPPTETPPVTTQPETIPSTGGEVVSVDPDEGTALVVDGAGNVNVVDNTDGTLAPGDTIPPAVTPSVTPEQVEKIVNDAIKANPGLTAADVQKIVSDAVATVPNLTAEQVKQIVGTEVAKVPSGVTSTEVKKAIDDAIAGIEFPAGLTKDDVTNSVAKYMEENPGLSLSDVAAKITEATKDLATTEGTKTAISDALKGYATTKDIKDAIAGIEFPVGLTPEDVTKSITDYMTANPGLSAADVTKAITDYMTANPGLTAADLNTAISDATKGLATTEQVGAVQTDVDALEKLIGSPGGADAEATGIIGQLEAMGLTDSQILEVIGAPATETEPATGLYKAAEDAAVRGENAAGAVQTELSKVIGAPSVADDPNTPDVDESLAASGLYKQIEDSQAETAKQVGGVQTDVDALEKLIGEPGDGDVLGTGVFGELEALGLTDSQILGVIGAPATETEPATGLYKAADDAAVRGENAAQAVQTELSKIIGAPSVKDDPATLDIDESLAATGLYGQIEASQSETAGQIGALSADMQAKYDALTAEQKALADAMNQQGLDLTTAINLAAQQTQAQITGLGAQVDTRINELMQQGQTYQEATQQAIGELNTQNQQLQGLVGTQGRQATQADIDALSQMLGGQRSMDLTYDVTGDKQITQADIDFLTQVVGGTNTDWKAPVGSAWGATGLYGQLAANEAQRQADLQAQLAREEAARQAAIEAERQGKIANIKSTAARGGQDIRALGQQLPKAFETTSTPLYGTMEYFDPFGDPFADPFGTPKMRIASSTNPADQTKMAAGGYIDDLLAGEMTVDDLLNLLR